MSQVYLGKYCRFAAFFFIKRKKCFVIPFDGCRNYLLFFIFAYIKKSCCWVSVSLKEYLSNTLTSVNEMLIYFDISFSSFVFLYNNNYWFDRELRKYFFFV